MNYAELVYLDRYVLINGRFDPGWLERGDAIRVEQLAGLAFVLANDSCPVQHTYSDCCCVHTVLLSLVRVNPLTACVDGISEALAKSARFAISPHFVNCGSLS